MKIKNKEDYIHFSHKMNQEQKSKMKMGMKKTLERLMVAKVFRKDSKQPQGANLHAVLVLCICCFIDALGKYHYGGQANKCSFKKIIKNYMPSLYGFLLEKANEERKYQEYYLDIFYSHVRSGLVHEYFPKENNEVNIKIQRHNCSPLISGDGNELIICLPALCKEFIYLLDKSNIFKNI